MLIIDDMMPRNCEECRYFKHEYFYSCSLNEEVKTSLLERPKECPIRELSLNKGFGVIDKKTGEYPDLEKIAIEEDWAKGLCYCDMEGFALSEDGELILMDECGRLAYCPPDRFEVVMEASE